MSHDGRYVAFTSSASNLVPGDTNEQSDVFVHDRQTGRTVRASVASDGTQADGGSLAAALSGDGRYLTFNSIATNLVDGDTNMQDDVFVRDLVSGRTTRVSVSSDGVESDGGLVRCGDQRRRSAHRFRQHGDDPRSGRHQRTGRRIRARRPGRHDRPRLGSDGRHAADPARVDRGRDQRRRAVCRFPERRRRARPRRHQRSVRHLPPRPRLGHHRARLTGGRRSAGQ